MAQAEIIGEKIVLTVPVEKVLAGTKEQLETELNNYPIEVIPVKKISSAQNGLIHVLLKQYGDELGWTMSDMKEYLKEQFALSYDLFEFSTSKCDMQTANEFITYIIEHALENKVNLYIMNRQDGRYRHIIENDSITNRYIVKCLYEKICVITNKPAQLDHWDNVSQIGGYEYCNGLKTRFLPLCQEMHDKKHTIGREAFKELYHIEGIWLNENLVRELKKVYPNHFKGFKEG